MSKSFTTPYGGFDDVFIAGEWRKGRSGKNREDKAPYNSETLVEIPLADSGDLGESYRAAGICVRPERRAYPLWGRSYT